MNPKIVQIVIYDIEIKIHPAAHVKLIELKFRVNVCAKMVLMKIQLHINVIIANKDVKYALIL